VYALHSNKPWPLRQVSSGGVKSIDGTQHQFYIGNVDRGSETVLRQERLRRRSSFALPRTSLYLAMTPSTTASAESSSSSSIPSTQRSPFVASRSSLGQKSRASSLSTPSTSSVSVSGAVSLESHWKEQLIKKQIEQGQQMSRRSRPSSFASSAVCDENTRAAVSNILDDEVEEERERSRMQKLLTERFTPPTT
jgi:hypothetical protein